MRLRLWLPWRRRPAGWKTFRRPTLRKCDLTHLIVERLPLGTVRSHCRSIQLPPTIPERSHTPLDLACLPRLGRVLHDEGIPCPAIGSFFRLCHCLHACVNCLPLRREVGSTLSISQIRDGTTRRVDRPAAEAPSGRSPGCRVDVSLANIWPDAPHRYFQAISMDDDRLAAHSTPPQTNRASGGTCNGCRAISRAPWPGCANATATARARGRRGLKQGMPRGFPATRVGGGGVFGCQFLLAIVHCDGTDMKLRGRSIAEVTITLMSWERNLSSARLTIFSRLAVMPRCVNACEAAPQWAALKAVRSGRAAMHDFRLH